MLAPMTTSLRERAIVLMKEGRTPDEIETLFVWEGADATQARAVVAELAALQRKAAAMDPARLRAEAHWMFSQGAAVEHVVAHFVQAGVAEAHARPEAERLHAAFRSLVPCQRCGAPTPPSETVFDQGGFRVCNSCNLRDEIGRSEQRGLVRDFEVLGALGGLGALASTVGSAIENMPVGGTAQPFCGRCRAATGVAVTRFTPDVRARLDPTAAWVCPRCWQKIA